MEGLFLDVATLSLTCSLVLLPALLLARVLSRRYAAGSLSVLWLLLALRLALPVSASLPRAPVTITAPAYTMRIPAVAAPAAGNVAEPVAHAASRGVDLTTVLAAAWLAGVALFLCCQIGAYVWARRKLLRDAEPFTPARSLGLRAVRSPGAAAPMLLGLFRPVLVLPAEGADAEGLDLAIRHELCHLRRRDTLYKAVLLAANAVHWFNPLVWLMAREGARNLELCCDDDVLRDADRAQRRQYGEILLSAASSRHIPMFSTRFGSDKRDIKDRLWNLFAKKRRGAGVVCVLLCAALLMGALISCDTQPQETPTPEPAASPDAVGGDVSLDSLLVNDSAGLIAAAAEKQMGVDFPVIDYMSEDLLVFHDYWGLAVYDFRQRQIVRLADTPAIGMNLIQGDQYTEVRVSEDLDRIMLWNAPPQALPEDEAWVYLLGDDVLMETTVREVEGEAYAKSTAAKGAFFFADGAEPIMAELSYRAADGAEYRVFDRPEFDPGAGWQWPLDGCYTVTATFGPRIHPVTGRTGDHTGTDIAAPEDTPVRAARGGVVTESAFHDEDGNYVQLDHGDGTATRYSHLSSAAAEVGQVVEQGQVIGYVGNTGSATGYHLHFELRKNDARGDILTKYPNVEFTYR